MSRAKKRVEFEERGSPIGASDFARAELGNTLRTDRLVRITEVLCTAPEESFPRLMESADLEGYYRFVNNEAVDPRLIVKAHAESTVGRIRDVGTTLAVHDTSELKFPGEVSRENLEQLSADHQGLRGHFTLAVSAASTRPLGVLALETWTRIGKPKLTKAQKKLKKFELREDKESGRWWRGVQAAEALAGFARPIHVMDREGDSYELFARLIGEGYRFLIRSGHCPRRVQACLEGPVLELRAALENSKDFTEVEVPISMRPASDIPGNAKKHPPRASRIAKLRFSAIRVSVKRPKRSPHLQELPEALDLNLVYVHEVDAPDGAEPVEWILATSEPIETATQVTAIVNWYRARWLIEEFFKALKTGCALERRQHHTRAAIEIALAIFLPVACQLLDLRNLARRCPEEPATTVLSPTQIEVLQACSRKPPGKNPTIRECFLSIAADGGHLPHNGEPGWRTLAKGFQRLNDAVPVWEAARRGGRKPDR